MDAGSERRREDLRRLESMCAASGGRLRVISKTGDPPRHLAIELLCRTAATADYPARSVRGATATIYLPARYPFQEPLAEITSPIFHPNVYTSGRICFGGKWLPTEGLDLLVRRIAQIVVFDPSVLNVSSPANARAAAWYQVAVGASPSAFPTDSLSFLSGVAVEARIQWRDLFERPGGGRSVPAAAAPLGRAGTSGPTGKTVYCHACMQWLRVSDGSNIRVRCPKCGHQFWA